MEQRGSARRRYIQFPNPGLLLAASLALAPTLACTRAPDLPPNLVLVTVDTLRADHLGCYGHADGVSPSIDALAAEGIRFSRAIAQATWTLPSMATIHTSLLPSQHGATKVRHKLRDDHTTIAEVLSRAGYHTIAVVSHTFVDEERGFSQGFEDFDESQVLGARRKTSPGLTRIALELASAAPEPYFLWVHYFDPHDPFLVHPEIGHVGTYEGPLDDPIMIKSLRQLARAKTASGGPALRPEDLEYVRAVYDEEITFTDAAIGSLVDGLRAARPERGVVFALTADHGEAFMDHGHFGHGDQVYDEVVRVPLILAGDLDPTLRGRTVDTPVEIASIPKTLAALASVPDESFAGSDLLDLARRPDEDGTAISQGGSGWSPSAGPIAVVGKRWKLVHQPGEGAGTFELYDLDADPAERSDLWARHSPELEPVKRALSARALQVERSLRNPRSNPTIEPSREKEQLLQDLGYLE